jgi:hypothetical protein
MKNVFIVFMCLVGTGCKEAETAARAARESDGLCASGTAYVTDGIQGGTVSADSVTDGNGATLGLWVEDLDGLTWVNQSGTSYFFAVDPTTGAVQRANSVLVFHDENCTQVAGEEFRYPLHMSGDKYVFPYEDDWYEYNLGGDYGQFPTSGDGYYFKAEGGTCNFCPGVISNLRQVTPSAVTGIDEQYQGPITH